MRQRANRHEQEIAMDAMAASIAHEINQPLAAMVANANAGVRWLTRATPDLDEARAALGRVVDDGHRAGRSYWRHSIDVQERRSRETVVRG